VFYRQQRIGRLGQPFKIVKFRTMVDGADRLSANVSPCGDPRVTGVGRFLRGWYLDELPQLFNVIAGEMRLVGPRPETPEFVALYTARERRVLEVKPGLVGPSTLGFMDEAERLATAENPGQLYATALLHERVCLDLKYLDQQSMSYDLRILLRQAVAIISRSSRRSSRRPSARSSSRPSSTDMPNIRPQGSPASHGGRLFRWGETR
jgi:lipopolysaccharide/colanic/teichoic acid biosynthesis glycosyltransferase